MTITYRIRLNNGLWFNYGTFEEAKAWAEYYGARSIERIYFIDGEEPVMATEVMVL